jgi:sugar phosphate isomerase/epimerase
MCKEGPNLKFSYTLSTPDTKNPDALAWRGDFRESCARLKEMGYEGVELMVRSPKELDGPQIKAIVDEFELVVPNVCTGEVFGVDRLSFTDPDQAVRKQAIQRTKEVIDFAALLGSQINVGRLRGSYQQGVERTQSEQWAREAFSELLEYAGPRNVYILLEPANHHEINFLCSSQEGLEFLRPFNNPYFGIMLDIYHMHIEDRSIAASFIEAGAACRHIHFSDSTRRYPGTGNMNFVEILAVLKALDYQGFVSLEILQLPSQEVAAQRSIEYLRFLCKNL